jgi:tRNA/rRNA methyltransferase
MLSVVLIRPQNPANIGFVARAMANFELEKLLLVSPCSHLEDEALKTAMHAKSILRKAEIVSYPSLRKKFDLLVGTTSAMGSDYNIPRTPLLPEDFARKLGKQRAAILFGNEGSGLSNKEINGCDFIIAIPTSRKYPALNISHAAAIIFYEIYRNLGKNKITSHIVPASVREREIMLKKLDNIIDTLKFSTKEKKVTQKKVWKKVLEQSMMSRREAFAVIGLLRKLDEKLSSS